MSLGRIFNVVGAIIDRYLGFSLSSQFNILIPMDLGMFIESHEQYAYTLCYLNALQIFRQPLILFEFSCYIHNELFWYATTTINIDWLFYTCNLYLGLILKVNRPACPYTSMNECLTASLSLGCALHFFNAETHFAWFKPIHNTSVTICSVMLCYVHNNPYLKNWVPILLKSFALLCIDITLLFYNPVFFCYNYGT